MAMLLSLTEVGQHQMWAAHYKYKAPRISRLGTMAMVPWRCDWCKMARKDKLVFNIAGDGCFRMNMNEIAQQT